MSFCVPCRSHFCVHVAPHLYDGHKINLKRGRYEGASNTLVLDRNHQQGIARGSRGQSFAAEQLGVTLAEEGTPYDFRAADGTRVDVKTSRWGMPLMIPATQRYKLSTKRTDAFLLVWDGPEMKLVGQVSVGQFSYRHHTDGPFPIPTLHVEATELDPVPATWYAPENRA